MTDETNGLTYNKRQLRQAIRHLEKGHALLKKPGVLIAGSIGLDENFNDLGFGLTLAKAVQVCSVGALSKIAKLKGYEGAALPAGRFLACAIDAPYLRDGGDPEDIIVNFNDSKDHKSVLNAWKRAIRKARTALNKMEKRT